MNNSHLKDKYYLEQIKKVIRENKLRYAVPVYNFEKINEINLEDIQFSITDQLFFETLLMEIRGKTISYSAFIKKKTNMEEKKLLSALDELGKTVEHSDENLKEMEKIKEDLENKLLEAKGWR